jgi:hypothetical protein
MDTWHGSRVWGPLRCKYLSLTAGRPNIPLIPTGSHAGKFAVRALMHNRRSSVSRLTWPPQSTQQGCSATPSSCEALLPPHHAPCTPALCSAGAATPPLHRNRPKCTPHSASRKEEAGIVTSKGQASLFRRSANFVQWSSGVSHTHTHTLCCIQCPCLCHNNRRLDDTCSYNFGSLSFSPVMPALLERFLWQLMLWI